MVKCYRALLILCTWYLTWACVMNVPYVYLAYMRFSLSVPVIRRHGLVAIVLGLCIFHYVKFNA
jgi:hypothetical protein